VVQNDLGLNLLAAARLVRLCSRFKSHIDIKKESRFANPRSILGLVAIGAIPGSQLKFTFEGEDAGEARNAIKDFFANRFEDGSLLIRK
jgi:phosphocarrier protein HPr